MSIRRALRATVLRLFARMVHTHEARSEIFDLLDGSLYHSDDLAHTSLHRVPDYPDVAPPEGSAVSQSEGGHRPRPIFVSARFRSGSTLLWTLFRSPPDVTAYYEPLHPRLGLAATARRGRVDPSHLHVEDYWSEYDAIEKLHHLYRPEWDQARFYLRATDWEPALERYLSTLITHAPGRAVLQFNRADFRLPWLRATYPDAWIVHLYRHPRSQWLSMLSSPDAIGPQASNAAFTRVEDRFFVRRWADDLRRVFPVLDWSCVAHPYEMHYLLWKLSYCFGAEFSDVQLCYERLLAEPVKELTGLLTHLDLDVSQASRIAALVQATDHERWREYAPPTWFEERERAAEALLARYFRGLEIARARKRTA